MTTQEQTHLAFLTAESIISTRGGVEAVKKAIKKRKGKIKNPIEPSGGDADLAYLIREDKKFIAHFSGYLSKTNLNISIVYKAFVNMWHKTSANVHGRKGDAIVIFEGIFKFHQILSLIGMFSFFKMDYKRFDRLGKEHPEECQKQLEK
jgi:hypothetical protein